MTNPVNKQQLKSIKDRLNYRSAKLGMSRGNLANFTTFTRRNLAESFFLGFFFRFLYTGLDYAN